MACLRVFGTCVVAARIAFASAGSVKNCGGTADHLRNVSVSLTPDPLQKGKPFSLVVTGDLDEDFSDFSLTCDLQVSLLRVIHAVSVTGQLPFHTAPAIPKGPQTIQIGPVTLPKNIPGSIFVKGQVHLINGKQEPAACLEVDLNVPALEDEDEAALTYLPPPSQPRGDDTFAPLTAPLDGSITSCTAPTDHLKNFTMSTSGGVLRTQGTLDEPVTKGSLLIDVTVKVLFVHLPVRLSAGFLLLPGLLGGPTTVDIGPVTGSIKPNIKVGVSGSVAMNDASDQEVGCLNVNGVVAASAHAGTLLV